MEREGTIGSNSNKISESFNLYLEIDPNFSVNNVGGSMVTPNINLDFFKPIFKWKTYKLKFRFR